jgi:hypothetical protein
MIRILCSTGSNLTAKLSISRCGTKGRGWAMRRKTMAQRIELESPRTNMAEFARILHLEKMEKRVGIEGYMKAGAERGGGTLG